MGARRWVGAGVGVVLFMGLNVGVSWFYHDRIYPGVRVGTLAVGGLSAAAAEAKLTGAAELPALTATVGSVKYELDVKRLAGTDSEATVARAKAVGRSSWLPVVGLAEAWLAQPVSPQYRVDEVAVRSVVRDLAGRADYRARDAVPLVVGGQVIMVAERPGRSVDQAVSVRRIVGAIGKGGSVTLATEQVAPVVSAADYAGAVAGAQARMALRLVIAVKKVSYSPTGSQIGGWLRFGKPGSEVVVDETGVGAYVGTLPGRFDRKAAVAAVVGAVTNGQNLAYRVSTKAVTAVKPEVTANGLVATYRVCLRGDDRDGKLAAVLGDVAWRLDGRVMFAVATADCDVRLSLVPVSRLGAVAQGCVAKLSCVVPGELAVNAASWADPPVVWKAGLAAYRTEVVNHVLGQWLGFDHGSCVSGGVLSSESERPAVVLGGCAPNWYVVPAAVLETRAWPSF